MPSFNYTDAQFKADLEELTNLINNYQSGGGNHKKSHKTHKDDMDHGMNLYFGGKKRSLDADGKPIRSFRVVKVNGRDVSGSKAYATRYYHGTKKNNTPGKAAEHAFSKLCGYTGQKKAKCSVTFTLMETTKGGNSKLHGPFKGKFIKLKKPIEIKRKGSEPYMVHFKSHVVHTGSK